MSVVYEAAMKRIIFLMLLVFSITGCKDSGSEKTDTDINSDADIIETEEEEPDETYIDEDADELVDDENYCPELSKADFPYYNKDGNYTFCRKCDTPTEKDPQCMANLWEQSEKKLLRWAPKYTCSPLPCVMDNLKPMTKEECDAYFTTVSVPMHKCDLMVDPAGYTCDATHGGIQHWNMSNGKIGFRAAPFSSGCSIENCPSLNKLTEYDIKTQKYKFIIPLSDEMLSYKNGNAIVLSGDYRTFDKYMNTGYLTYVSSEGDRQVVLNQQVNQILYDPEINENWAAVNWNANKKGLFYAKIGEWDWHPLYSDADEQGGYYPSLADNYLAAVDYNVNAYICDLSTSPKYFSTDCYQLNREKNETGNDPVFDSEDSNRMVFYSTKGTVKKIKLATNINGVWKQSDLITEFTEEFADGYSLVPYTFKGNLLMYNEVKGMYVARPCFYRLDTKEKICMKGMVHPATGKTVYPYGFGEFEDKYYLYQKLASTPLILRDLECYCKEEGICPLSDESETDDSDAVNDEQ